MKQYKVLYEIRQSSFSVTDPFDQTLGELAIEFERGTVITLSDVKLMQNDVVAVTGLCGTVDIAADDVDQAVQMATVRINAFLSILCFAMNATVGDVRVRLAYELTQDSQTTQYFQVEYLEGEIYHNKRAIDHDRFKVIGERLLSKANNRVSRAVRWYSKGLTEKDPLDRFMSYWVGLENLNDELAQLLGGNSEIRYCEACKAPYVVPTSKGIRAHFAMTSKNGVDDFKVCRDLRVALQHGAGDLSILVEKAEACSELCRLALFNAICLVLDVTIVDDRIVDQPVYNTHHPRVEFRGEYIIPPKDLTQVPIVQFSNSDVRVGYVNGKKVLTIVDTIDSNIHANMTIHMAFVSEHGVTMSITEVKHVPRHQTSRS